MWNETYTEMDEMAGKPKRSQVDRNNKVLQQLAKQVRDEVRRRHGSDLTFEQRRDAAASVMGDVLWVDEAQDLEELTSDDDEIDIEGVLYRRLEQSSSAVYYGRWGSHHVVESLYRQVGVHNGPTVKPLEYRVGMISRHMTPDLARIVGELSADSNSREVETILGAVGLVSPSRSFLEKRTTQMAGQMASEIECLEQEAREREPTPAEVASVSCGMDRMAIRMAEPADPETTPSPQRTEPYQRTPPPPKDHNYRMAWVGSTTAYDKNGDPLHTWRYAVEANADSDEIAHRVTADTTWLVRQYPGIPVQCIQDGAPELVILPKMLTEKLPADTAVNQLVDFEHLMGYLDKVVDACEPNGDPKDRKGQYRAQLLEDDGAIDRIWRKLQRLEGALPKTEATESKREAIAAALSYIGKRKDNMRYASFHSQGLAIGSGATEGTVGLMQQRVKRRGQSWETRGLRGVLNMRCLVLSGRWGAAWQAFAADHRKEVRAAA